MIINKAYKITFICQFMNNIMSIIMLVCSMLLVTGCTSTNTIQENQKDTIATTFFVTDEITKKIVEDTLEVELIIPKEISPHDYEPIWNRVLMTNIKQFFKNVHTVFFLVLASWCWLFVHGPQSLVAEDWMPKDTMSSEPMLLMLGGQLCSGGAEARRQCFQHSATKLRPSELNNN